MSQNKAMTYSAVNCIDNFVEVFRERVNRFCWDQLGEDETGTYLRVAKLLDQVSWEIDEGEQEKLVTACSTCVWYHSSNEQVTDSEKGLCRKHAPEFVVNEGNNTGRWPVVRQDDWCGFHETED